MTSILMIIGVFAGISVCMATFYSVAQAITREGRRRWAHVAAALAMLAVMGALLEREVGVARVLAVALLPAATWAFVVERGWYRLFPLLLQVFALVLIAGAVALAPL
jgi:hypothetical protein